jgi:hypothetical protein
VPLADHIHNAQIVTGNMRPQPAAAWDSTALVHLEQALTMATHF